jgi:hypothetical protein
MQPSPRGTMYFEEPRRRYIVDDYKAAGFLWSNGRHCISASCGEKTARIDTLNSEPKLGLAGSVLQCYYELFQNIHSK